VPGMGGSIKLFCQHPQIARPEHLSPISGLRPICKEQRRDLLSRSATIVLVPLTWKYTAKQGQYLAFIYSYTKIHGCAPAEAEIQRYFRVTPPSVHQMILTLERHGLITRAPGVARSIRLAVPATELPPLE
jgi:DNA-binding MarR family transcriptional regulator